MGNNGNCDRLYYFIYYYYFLAPKSLWTATATMKLKDACSLEEKLWPTYSILKSRDITLPTKVHLVKSMVFPVVTYGCEKSESESEVTQLSPTFCDPKDSSWPDSSSLGISQARILDWVAISFSRGSRRSPGGSDGKCSHAIKRCLLLGRKAMTNLYSIYTAETAFYR